MVGQFGGFVIGLSCACIPQEHEIFAFEFFVICAALASCISLCVREDLRRANF